MHAQAHSTLTKFGFPDNLIHQGRHWAVLVRPAQPTLGSLVLCAIGEQTSYGDLPTEAFAEQRELVRRIERTLQRFTNYAKINFLMLMMVDPHVHFHVLPRYEGERHFAGVSFPDRGWPALPDLAATQPSSPELVEALRNDWQLAVH